MPEQVMAQIEFAILFLPHEKEPAPMTMLSAARLAPSRRLTAGNLNLALYVAEFTIIPVWMVVLPLLADRLSVARAKLYLERDSWLLPQLQRSPLNNTSAVTMLEWWLQLLLVAEQLELTDVLYDRLVDSTQFAHDVTVNVFADFKPFATPLWIRYWMTKTTLPLLSAHFGHYRDSYAASNNVPDDLFILTVGLLRWLGPRFGRSHWASGAEAVSSEVHMVGPLSEEKEALQLPLGVFSPSFVLYSSRYGADHDDPDRLHGWTWRAHLLLHESETDVQRALVALDLIRTKMAAILPASVVFASTPLAVARWHALLPYVNDLLSVPIARNVIPEVLQEVGKIPKAVGLNIVAGYWSSFPYVRRRHSFNKQLP